MPRVVKCLCMMACLVLICLHGPAFGDESRDGWTFTETVRNPGTRSEYIDTSLSYEGLELPGDYASVITPLGIFEWTTSAWPPTRAGFWARYHGPMPEFEDMEPLGPDMEKQGYYHADPGFRIADTPSHWFYSSPCGCWIDPARSLELLPLFGLEAPPASSFEDQGQGIPFPEPIVLEPIMLEQDSAPERGSVLEQRMKAILAALNEHDQNWRDAVSQEDQIDPWGTPFEVERLAERDAGLHGYEYIVHCAGEDQQFGTRDDLALHDEVPPGFHPSPILMIPEEEEPEE